MVKIIFFSDGEFINLETLFLDSSKRLVNLELNKSVDKFYGKPYDEKKTLQCDKFIYKLIPDSKKEIDKLVKSGIY